MKEESHLKHHAQPSTTVIHHPDEDATLLGRWLLRGLEMGTTFWVGLAAVVVACILVTLLSSRLFTGESKESKAWMDLAVARTSDEQTKVAEEYPKSPAARWARLEAAGSIYSRAFDMLPQNKDEASPFLKRAYTMYSEVYEESQKSDPPLARMAALGMGRTLEASNDLARAREQYQKVASTWPGTDEAKLAERLAKALADKRNVEFYEWLAKYKAPEVTLPPLGKGLLDLPSPLGSFGTIPPPTSGVPAGAVGGSELPTNIFEPPASPAPGATPPAATSPAPAPTSAPAEKSPAPAAEKPKD